MYIVPQPLRHTLILWEMTLYKDNYLLGHVLSYICSKYLLTPELIFQFYFHSEMNEVASQVSMPERIYNSHYGNGVPAMFTS